jgi:Uma2 family endonuclease
MAVIQGFYTRADFDRLPEGFPGELVEGNLVREPAPTFRHNRIAARVRARLLALLGPDRVPDTPADVAIDDHNVFQPDIVVLAGPALAAPPDDDSSYVGVPILAVEVLSPSTRDRDRRVKADRLLEIGVGEVWLVDPIANTIEVREPGTRRFARGGDRADSRVVAGFALVPAALFGPPARS